MWQRREVSLSDAQRAELETLRDHDPQPYVREKAAGILKVADGAPIWWVAEYGVLQVRHRQTVSEWIVRYESAGAAGLRVRPGRGRKPAFSPQCATKEEATLEILHVVRRDPRLCGVETSRWSLTALREQLPWLAECHLGSISRLLDRLQIRYKRGREYVHSPDPQYLAKLAYHDEVVETIHQSADRLVGLYLDELTYYRQPTVARTWEAEGHEQGRAERAHGTNTATRVLGALDLVDGQVHHHQSAHTTLPTFVRFYQDLVAAYPQAERLTIFLDNWPVHFHPDLLVGLEPQLQPFPLRRPPSWPTEPTELGRRRWGDSSPFPIQLVPLPTYASWLNPIEKLWRWLKADVLHMHRLATRLPDLRRLVVDFLADFAHGSLDLLRYVGLAKAV